MAAEIASLLFMCQSELTELAPKFNEAMSSLLRNSTLEKKKNSIHPAAKGVQQKESGKKVTKKVTKVSEKVTESVPKTKKKVIELLLPRSFCGTLKYSARFLNWGSSQFSD